MNEPQSADDTERLPDRATAASPELTLLPNRGDSVGEAVPPPNPVCPSGLTDDEIEPPIQRHDPFAWTRNAPWMDRRLSPSGRAAILLRRDLEAFPVIEGRDPNHADLDAIVKRTVDYIVPIIRREQATDFAYEELEKRRADRIAKVKLVPGNVIDSDVVKVSGRGAPSALPKESDPELEIARRLLNERLNEHAQDAPPPPSSIDYETALRRLEGLRNPRGIAPTVEPLPGTIEYEKSRLEAEKLSPDWKGQRVILSSGLDIPDRYSPTGKVMAPVTDLAAVAAAGREAGNTFRSLAISIPTLPVAAEYLRRALRDNIGQGGRFDYQRRRDEADPDTFVQLRQFRDISNVNVGLFCQQAGMSLHKTLLISGHYAVLNSSNADPSRPYSLDVRTREFIEVGHALGKSRQFE